MSTPTKRRVSPGAILGVAACTLALAAPAQAAVHHLAANSVHTKQLARGAVTSPKIRNHTITPIDLARNAVPAKVVAYPVQGAFDFSSLSSLCIQIPGSVDQVRNGVYTAKLSNGTTVSTVPGWGTGGASEYRIVIITINANREACIVRQSGPGELYQDITIYQTIQSRESLVQPPTARVAGRND